MTDQDRKVMQGDGRRVEAVEDTKLHPETIAGDPVSPDGPTDLTQLGSLAASLTLGSLGGKTRLDQIKESHALLRQFTPRELKILTNLKRNTSTKAWSLREDLVVLTLPMSNRELAHLLHDRNKEAVKKRLQLLRSKGLSKR
ncbi:MAG: hypothetical protein LDL33_06815 [Desulfomonile sp.]|nr:hypothetical protein [Desulfomonile sp.]